MQTHLAADSDDLPSFQEIERARLFTVAETARLLCLPASRVKRAVDELGITVVPVAAKVSVVTLDAVMKLQEHFGGDAGLADRTRLPE